MTTIIQRQRQTSQEKDAPLTSVKVSAHIIQVNHLLSCHLFITHLLSHLNPRITIIIFQ